VTTEMLGARIASSLPLDVPLQAADTLVLARPGSVARRALQETFPQCQPAAKDRARNAPTGSWAPRLAITLSSTQWMPAVEFDCLSHCPTPPRTIRLLTRCVKRTHMPLAISTSLSMVSSACRLYTQPCATRRVGTASV
jgi:hypothetical protein